MAFTSFINIYFKIDKSQLVSDHTRKIIGHSINQKYNRIGNQFSIDVNTGFINFKLNTHGFPIQSKLKNESEAKIALMKHLKTIDSNIKILSQNKNNSNADELPEFFPDYLKIYITKHFDDGFSNYWESILVIELETGLPHNKFKNATLNENYIKIKYNENLIIELDYSTLPITNTKKESCLVNLQLLNHNEYVLFYEDRINSNMIIPYCSGFDEIYSLTQFNTPRNYENIDKSSDLIRDKINSFLLKVTSYVPKSQHSKGVVKIKCSVLVIVIDNGYYNVKKAKLIDEYNVNSVFNSIYPSNLKFNEKAINQGNYIFVKEFSNTSPPSMLNETDRTKIGDPLFKDYYEIYLQFEFNFYFVNNYIEALDFSGSNKRDSNTVIICDSYPSNRFTEYDMQSSIFEYIILKNINQYCGRKINAGIYYNELAWNPNLIIFLIKYQLELSSNEGIEVYKDYERLKDITLDFIKQSRIPEHKFKPYSKNNKSLARWNDGTKLIFLNPRYDRDLEYEKDHFNKVIAHELFHFLSKIHHKDEYDYPDYTMLATPMTVRASETDMLNMLISNWDSPLFILHD